MPSYDLSHLSDIALDRNLVSSDGREKSESASALAHFAEFDWRKLYLAKGYPTMQAYCVAVLNHSDDEAQKRMQVARVGRRFPALFSALADGRLHLTGARLLAPHLTEENVDELIAGASGRTCAEIELMLGRRVVRLETMRTEGSPAVIAAPSPTLEVALIDPNSAARQNEPAVAPPPKPGPTPIAVESSPSVPKPEPCAWVAIEKCVQEKLEYARALLSHRMPHASASMVLERALDDLIAKEEMHKFAAADQPRLARPSVRPRHIPARVKRAVWKRDGGRCTFVGDDGHRCGSRKFIEFDHIDPVARGGKATVDRIRLRCRAHNQYEAERVFGATFMQRKREQGSEQRIRAHMAKPG